MNNLLIDIARCEEEGIARKDNNHPCNKIVTCQSGRIFHLPEPWNGNLHEAEVLFVSSNPSYNPNECFPSSDWDDKDIESFFQNRFKNDYYKGIRYWKLIKKYASWILNTQIDDPRLPDKICITEIVHCKSTAEKGVRNACSHCAEKWLSRIISEFNGNTIVVMGNVAKGPFQSKVTNKTTLYMPHPNARGITDVQRKEILLR